MARRKLTPECLGYLGALSLAAGLGAFPLMCPYIIGNFRVYQTRQDDKMIKVSEYKDEISVTVVYDEGFRISGVDFGSDGTFERISFKLPGDASERPEEMGRRYGSDTAHVQSLVVAANEILNSAKDKTLEK